MVFLRLPQVIEKIKVSKSTLWKMVRDGKFPAQVKLTERTSAWIEEEVDEWCKQRIYASAPSAAHPIGSPKFTAPAQDKARPRLLPKSKILSLRKIELTSLCGIYFLFSGNEIVYIGQSINVFSSIAQHQNIKDFDAFTYIEIPQSELDAFEAEYISQYKPKLNRAMPQAEG
jgi:prophage regulatory protein